MEDTQLARRLREVVATRYDGKARRAALAAGLNENAVSKVLESRHHLPTVETLDKMSTAYGWQLGDVVYWALDRETPAPATDPPHAVAAILAGAGYREGDREFITEIVRRLAPTVIPASASNSE